MRRVEDAQAALEEAMQIYRELAKTSPSVYQPRVDTIRKALAMIAADANVTRRPAH
jgi:hypothetical protein